MVEGNPVFQGGKTMCQGGRFNALGAILIGALIQTNAIAGPEAGPVQGAGAASYTYQNGASVPENPNLYPRLNAPLYPAPAQYAPPWNGATIITNQAFAPHEMLYPHEYRAMYPPFYYRVKGGWVVTPLGVKQNEVWRLQGTEVKVSYRAHRSPFARFFVSPR